MIAFIEAKKAGLFERNHWIPNLLAGLIVGIVALPLAMAFAIASGARPEQGLYTAIVAGALVSIFGGSRLQIAGPTGAFIVILAGVTAKYGIAGLQAATLMAGIILLLMGFARLGVVIKFIPEPVIVGFTAGIGIIIFVGQWQYFLGLADAPHGQFHQKLIQLLSEIPNTHIPTLLIAIFSLALVIITPKIRFLSRIPGPLMAMVAATLLQSFLHLPGVATLGSAFGGIPSGLPSLSFPDLSFSKMLLLIGPAFTIAMLGAIESLLSAVVADGMSGTRHDANQELIGQGIANIASPLLGGFAATGAIARTATNIRNGATGPLAGIVHSITLVAVLLVLSPLTANIPLAALAAILFVVAWNMSEVKHFIYILEKAPNADKIILGITFLLTVFADLVVAVNVGVILAILHFMKRMSETVETQKLEYDDLRSELREMGIDKLPRNLLIYEISGPMFFGAVENFENVLLRSHTDPEKLIIRLNRVPFMDMTGIDTLSDVMKKLKHRGIEILLSEANPRVLGKLSKAGLISGENDAGYASTFSDAVTWGLISQK